MALVLIAGEALPWNAVAWALVLGLLGASAIARGSLNGHQGALSFTSIYLLEPVLMIVVFAALLRRDECAGQICKWIQWSSLGVATVGILLYVRSFFSVDIPTEVFTGPGRGLVTSRDGRLKSNYEGFGLTVFLAPFIITRVMQSPRVTGLSTTYRIILLSSTLIPVILSGRSILFFSTPVALGVAFLLIRHTDRSPRRDVIRSFGVLALTAIIALPLTLASLGLEWNSIRTTIVNTATLTDDSGVRAIQADLLVNRWLESPIFGHGAATEISNYVRSASNPWQFELSLHLLLVNLGVVGFVILTGLVCATLIRLRWSRRELDRAMCAGLTGAIVASVSNPYLTKIDGMWMVFIPIAYAMSRATARQEWS